MENKEAIEKAKAIAAIFVAAMIIAAATITIAAGAGEAGRAQNVAQSGERHC